MRRASLIACIVAFFMLISGAALAAEAQRPSVFAISNVEIDVTAADAASARTLAIAEGQRKAYEILMRRLLRPEDVSRAPVVDPATLNGLIDGIEVNNERASAVRYLATLSVRFDASTVRGLLKANGLAFTQTMASPVLVVPVMTMAGAEYLWQPDNPWRQAWAEHDLANRLAPYRLPDADATDRLLASPREVIDDDNTALNRLAARYDLERTLVVRLTLEPDLAGEGYKGEITLAGTAGFPDLRQSVTLPSEGPTAENLGPAVERVVREIDDWWRGETLVRMDQGGELAVTAPLRSIADWAEVRRRLARVNLVEDMTIDRLTARQAAIVLHYVGEAEQLRLALRQASLVLDLNPIQNVLMLEEIHRTPTAVPVAPAALSQPETPDGGAGEPR